MSRWRAESGYAGRYVGTGVFNTLAGFAVIFAMMWAGFSPVAANLASYACGFVLGFVLSRRFVFRSQGSVLGEGGRYVLSFVVAYLLNLAVLRFAIERLGVPPAFAQVVAAAVFTVSMYGMGRLYTFAPRPGAGPADE